MSLGLGSQRKDGNARAEAWADTVQILVVSKIAVVTTRTQAEAWADTVQTLIVS
jgi:hypothetical protein